MHTIDQVSKNPKKPWPTKAAMQQVYSEHLWGGSNFDFYSGEGSHLSEFVEPYIEVATSFFNNFAEPISVCDLGCGDFNIGRQLFKYTRQYIGVDIVPELIERNKKLFKANDLEFRCLDIAKDKLPKADCVIIKEVLQHLSNYEVHNVVEKLSDYKYVILTEHVPKGDFEPNLDIISGQGTRLKKKSGINISKPPFNITSFYEKILLSISTERGVIDTKLYIMQSDYY